MSIDIVVPQVGEAISAARLVQWYKKIGDPVKQGEPLFAVDTDKAVLDVEAFSDGILEEILFGPDSEVQPEMVVGRLRSNVVAASPAPPPAPPVAAVPVAANPSRPTVPAPPPTPERTTGISPKARQLARELGVDVKQLSQRFGNRLITEEDIRNAAGAGTQVAPPAAAGVPLTRMREAIAQRTQRSKQEVPHFYLMGDVDMTAALHARRSGVAKCSLTILVARACALALREMPEANITFENRQLHVRNTIDLGVAVSVPGGLFVPVIRRADSRELAEMDAWLSETKGRLEKGKFRPTDFGERSLTISNLGMHQVDRFIAIIDQPDAAMLAVGAVEERAVVRDGAVVVRPMCTLTLSVDHRALDGVDGAKLLNLIRKNLAAAA